MFDSSYRGHQSRYSTYFTLLDSPPTRLQGDQKSSVYGWKCPHYRRSNLHDRSKTSVFGGNYLGTLKSELQNFAAVQGTFSIHQMCEKWQKSIRQKLVVFEVKVPGKLEIAEIVVQGTMFDSPYLGCQSRYSRYFTAIDSMPAHLQGDQKSLVYGWKCPHYRRSNLLNIRHVSCEGPCLPPHISEP